MAKCGYLRQTPCADAVERQEADHTRGSRHHIDDDARLREGGFPPPPSEGHVLRDGEHGEGRRTPCTRAQTHEAPRSRAQPSSSTIEWRLRGLPGPAPQ